MARIAEYNEYDCLSTLRLRDWLLAQVGDAAGDGGRIETPDLAEPDESGQVGESPEHDALGEALLAFAGESGDRTSDEQAVAMLSAALGYHWREEKPFWWAHYDRLLNEPSDWSDARGTLVSEPDAVEVLQDWRVPPGKQTARRRLRMIGRLEPGSDLRPGASAVALYDSPVPECARTSSNGIRGWLAGAVVVEVTAGTEGSPDLDVIVVDEALPRHGCLHDVLPMALAPAPGPTTGPLRAAIRQVAQDALAELQASPTQPHLPDQPALDLLRRIAPRTRSGGPLRTVAGGATAYVDALTTALLDLDDSYLAVQGPPGTGKMYTGSYVIARLVERGWRVGVVAQSHAVVENMLTAVSEAGVPPEQIGKKPAVGAAAQEVRPWQVLSGGKDPFGQFFARQDGGYVVGGTAWDLVNAARIPPERYDVLAIDEAGQFSLANTIAVSGAARNLLLLGDPQRLPQVSQGRHPEPVDRSALGWLADGHDTLPTELGYFLAHTWRMHPALCAVVSHLAYADRLSSVPATAERSLAGVVPGIRVVQVEHARNSVASPEEADEVVRQVRDLIGRRWCDPRGGTSGTPVDRPLEPKDVLVVAAYNAQVWTIQRALDAAGVTGVQVGTVDRFQGKGAPVVIMSMAASSTEDVPRGMEFLLSRNRINVAVSRGMWCAVVVRSRRLTDYLPARPEQLEELGAFLGLGAGGSRPSPASRQTISQAWA